LIGSQQNPLSLVGRGSRTSGRKKGSRATALVVIAAAAAAAAAVAVAATLPTTPEVKKGRREGAQDDRSDGAQVFKGWEGHQPALPRLLLHPTLQVRH
jgi:hypothetical protein